ncbi:MAG: hypothetical protein ACFN39_03310, partial [Lacticaseibacillus rhamnosus]
LRTNLLSEVALKRLKKVSEDQLRDLRVRTLTLRLLIAPARSHHTKNQLDSQLLPSWFLFNVKLTKVMKT